VKILFYYNPPDFWKSLAILQVPRLRPFVKLKYSGKTPILVPLCPPQTSRGRTRSGMCWRHNRGFLVQVIHQTLYNHFCGARTQRTQCVAVTTDHQQGGVTLCWHGLPSFMFWAMHNHKSINMYIYFTQNTGIIYVPYFSALHFLVSTHPDLFIITYLFISSGQSHVSSIISITCQKHHFKPDSQNSNICY
jgi:hypothetical protein